MKKLGVFLPAIVFLAAAFAMSFMPESTGPGGYKIGDTAQDFTLKNVNGKNVSLVPGQ